VPPDFLEATYAEFEGKVAPILKTLCDGGKCSEEDFVYVLNLITLLANRNPRHRETFAQFKDDVGQQMLQLMTGTEERWERQVKKS
jgi:hypothetical protein